MAALSEANLIDKIEDASLLAWPALEEIHYDGWLLRFSEGLSQRANSVWIEAKSDLRIENKIQYCDAMYRQRSLETSFRLTDYNCAENLESLLRAKHYQRTAETIVMVLDMKKFDGQLRRDILLKDTISNAWLTHFMRATRKTHHVEIATFQRIIKQLNHNVNTALIIEQGRAIALGYAHFYKQIIGVYLIYVDAAYRQMGYGKAIVNALLHSFQYKSRYAYLHVHTDNYKAIKLYQQLNFEPLYRYWFRKKSKQRQL